MANSLVRIPLEGGDEVVKLVIVVKGQFVWNLRYISEDATYYRGTKSSKSNTIVLGTSEDLIGDTDSWRLIIASPGDDEEGSIRLSWVVNGTVVDSWSQDLNTSEPQYEGMAFYFKK